MKCRTRPLFYIGKRVMKDSICKITWRHINYKQRAPQEIKTNWGRSILPQDYLKAFKKLSVMACLFDCTRVIKHNYFIKTGERLWPLVGEALAQSGVIWYRLTSVIPHSITQCSKSCGPSRVQWKRSTRERATLIKALLNLTISVRYRRAITPELLLLPFSCSFFPHPPPLYYFIAILFVFLLFCTFY